jgi:5-formyltetrahydrofolate cyclo-ligase
MKKSLRRHLIKKRKNLSKNFVFENSKTIEEKLFGLVEFKQASTILFYVSYNNEVNTHQMIKKCLNNGKNVIVPISKKEDRSLILSKLNNWDDLKKGSYGILEPENDKIQEVPIDKIDLIIVPGVGFDESGSRIGHGKGYYDNLLKKSKNILCIGLAFEAQIEKYIPAERQDKPVNKIVTEKRIIHCS